MTTSRSEPGPGAGRNGGKQESYPALDFARAGAALIVMAGHLRAFLMVDSGAVQGGLSPLGKAFYLVTSLGHQAVMIFFVMSGFLVGRHVFDAVEAGRWSWRDYAVRRLTRLWIVLIPALVLSGIWAWIGADLLHSPFYTGELASQLNLAPSPDQAAVSYGPKTFLINLLFLQGIFGPPYAANGPLWSLSYEFWYYLLFPLIVLGVRGRGTFVGRLLSLATAVAIAVLLPRVFVLYGVIWLMGFAIAMIRGRLDLTLSGRGLAAALLVTLSTFGAAMAASKLMSSFAGDLLCGGAFGALLYVLTFVRLRLGPVAAAGQFGADFSYTLYLTHFPFLAVVTAAVFHDQRLQPGPAAAATYLGLALATITYGVLVYLPFERNTRKVQSLLLKPRRPKADWVAPSRKR